MQNPLLLSRGARLLPWLYLRKAAVASVGVHGLYVQEIFTGGDMISPRLYDEFVRDYNIPYFKRICGLGLLPIHLVCGDVMPRLENMACYEVAAIAVEESKKNFRIEIEEVVKRVGEQVAVVGNIDAVHFGLHATPEEMSAEVKQKGSLPARAAPSPCIPTCARWMHW